MAKNKTKEGPKTRIANRIKARAVVHTVTKEIIIPDPETKKMVAELLEAVKKIDSRNLVMFHKISNLQADIATLQNRLQSVVRLLVVRDSPDELLENAAVIKQFIKSESTHVRDRPSDDAKKGY